MVLAFIGWLITTRKVGAQTIEKYLSGLRIVHLKRGILPGNLRPDLVKAIVRGHAQTHSKARIPRLPMTLPVMKLLKNLLTNSKMGMGKKRQLWAIACIAFHGSFRIHELLSRSESSFDPTTTLLGADIRLVNTKVSGEMEKILIIHLKCPKEDKLRLGVNIEFFSTGTLTCPIAAWTKWQQWTSLRLSPTKPVFRQENGKCMTGNLFNKELKGLLGRHVNYDEKRYLSHSFRSGFASMMAAAGYSDEVIMRQGRWHSKAFLLYCKTGRSSRLQEQRELARTLTK